MRKTKRPKLGGRPKNMYEAFAVARTDFRPPRKADKVGMTIITKSVVEIFSRFNDERLDKISRLVCAVT